MSFPTSKFVFRIVLIAAGLLQASTAMAQTDDQLRKWCFGDATDDQTIQGCESIIKAGKGTTAKIEDAFYNLGISYANKGQYDRAIQDYDQAIKLNPNYVKAFNNRGLSYDNKGQHDRAIQDYDQAIKLNPNDADAFYNRGLSHAHKGQYDRAIQDYDQAIKLDPNNAFALGNRADAVAKKKK